MFVRPLQEKVQGEMLWHFVEQEGRGTSTNKRPDRARTSSRRVAMCDVGTRQIRNSRKEREK